MLIPTKQLKAFKQGIRAWNSFKKISKQLARLNAHALKAEKEDIP